MRYHYSRNDYPFNYKTDISIGNHILGHEYARDYLGGFGIKLANLAEFPIFLMKWVSGDPTLMQTCAAQLAKNTGAPGKQGSIYVNLTLIYPWLKLPSNFYNTRNAPRRYIPLLCV